MAVNSVKMRAKSTSVTSSNQSADGANPKTTDADIAICSLHITHFRHATKAKTKAIPCSPNDAEFGSLSKPRLFPSPLMDCAPILGGHNECLHLTHHYFTVISPSATSAQPHLENFHGWASAVQHHWPMFEFVQYGICALSSLHLACHVLDSWR
ncbi:uncharacterized protein TRIVIDRAFT_197930 [Trichoderma virens Gv29-8]|uniref:Uncharacterized protein n=1 Tax=Hypocrea virens (strain Gv29-8 / FGSC 10586) TaxID=413071 RepID=G9MGA3_HYPVG|nr:uncharacterized protein TRIVIDRAFT_197930 [Trichoderma virens Gv29-8]EHK26552.1 hypothetical protein TRIVIDRAFT_197930 [Trichoderma virens Gv29-8]UKZ46732.1 hypothetical protein TrVGV298_000941 [Trichoderma virens]UKZ73312.1 hypothetical protein TrVFT333_000957 [Trichoderma virens FT-333]